MTTSKEQGSEFLGIPVQISIESSVRGWKLRKNQSRKTMPDIESCNGPSRVFSATPS